MWSENENVDFSKIVLPCTREHDFCGLETSKIEQKSQKNEEKTHCKKSKEKKQLFIDFWSILGPFWGGFWEDFGWKNWPDFWSGEKWSYYTVRDWVLVRFGTCRRDARTSSDCF